MGFFLLQNIFSSHLVHLPKESKCLVTNPKCLQHTDKRAQSPKYKLKGTWCRCTDKIELSTLGLSIDKTVIQFRDGYFIVNGFNHDFYPADQFLFFIFSYSNDPRSKKIVTTFIVQLQGHKLLVLLSSEFSIYIIIHVRSSKSQN